MLITYTFIQWIPHWRPQQPQFETRTSSRDGWRPPCTCRLLPLRSWPWGRPVCYEAVYWPLAQLCSTWNNLKDYSLLSWEARFASTSGFSHWPSASPGWFWLCGYGKLLARLTSLVRQILYLNMICLHYVIPEMNSFLKSVATISVISRCKNILTQKLS